MPGCRIYFVEPLLIFSLLLGELHALLLLLLLLLLFQREDLYIIITRILKCWNEVNHIGSHVRVPSTLNPLSDVIGFVCFITSCNHVCRVMRQYNFRKVFIYNPTFFVVMAILRDYSNVAGRLKGH